MFYGLGHDFRRGRDLNAVGDREEDVADFEGSLLSFVYVGREDVEVDPDRCVLLPKPVDREVAAGWWAVGPSP